MAWGSLAQACSGRSRPISQPRFARSDQGDHPHRVLPQVVVITSMTDRFEHGQIVIHTRRPEWGEGVVNHAQPIRHQGKDAQRLVIQFANHGRVTINTAVATIQTKETVNPMSSTTTDRLSGKGWLESIGQHDPVKMLSTLPDEMSDPFASYHARLTAVANSFRFDASPRALLDWAVAQTGLSDPLTRFNRQELELALSRYEYNRDQYLTQLVREMKHDNKADEVRQVARESRLEIARQKITRALRA